MCMDEWSILIQSAAARCLLAAGSDVNVLLLSSAVAVTVAVAVDPVVSSWSSSGVGVDVVAAAAAAAAFFSVSFVSLFSFFTFLKTNTE